MPRTARIATYAANALLDVDGRLIRSVHLGERRVLVLLTYPRLLHNFGSEKVRGRQAYIEVCEESIGVVRRSYGHESCVDAGEDVGLYGCERGFDRLELNENCICDVGVVLLEYNISNGSVRYCR